MIAPAMLCRRHKRRNGPPPRETAAAPRRSVYSGCPSRCSIP